MHFAQREYFALLWIIPVVLLLAVWAWRRRRTLAARLADSALARQLMPRRSLARSVVQLTLLLGGFILITLALARPQWGWTQEKVHRVGRDVCFVLDVSRSMLAEDLAPNRLERAKMWIRDALDVAAGDRTALVAFAGTSVVRAPLTHDRGFLRFTLEDVSPDDVTRGGTLIGDAIRLAAREVFDTDEATYRDIILITDGEDMESFPLEAAKAAGQAGIRLIVIGIGNEEVGSTIPITDDMGRTRVLEYDGEPVRTKLNGEVLREMALATPGGQYFNVQTGDVALDDVYERVVRGADQRMQEGLDSLKREERFQIFLAIGLAMFMMEGFVSVYRRS